MNTAHIERLAASGVDCGNHQVSPRPAIIIINGRMWTSEHPKGGEFSCINRDAEEIVRALTEPNP